MECAIVERHPSIESLRKVTLANSKDPLEIDSVTRHLQICYKCAQRVGTIKEGDFGDIWTPD